MRGGNIFSLYGGEKYFKFLSQMAVFLLFSIDYGALNSRRGLKTF
jgi:hypothetical protein